MSQTVIQTTLGSDLDTSETITLSYPAGKSRGDFIGGSDHYVMLGQEKYAEPAGASFAFNAANIVITYKGATTIPSGTAVVANLDEPGVRGSDSPDLPENVSQIGVTVMDLGSPITADADGISASQSVGAGANALINGALASGGVADLDVPRNVVAAWTGASVLTVEGYDKNGNAMSEASASGTSFTGKKAFDRVTKATFSAAVTGATIGTGNVLGLPSWLPGTGHVLRELQDGATAAAGTLVAGLATGTASTTTTADVRGTYTPNSAPDGSRAYKLIALLENPAFQGNPQA
jgi:hypothetical protein